MIKLIGAFMTALPEIIKLIKEMQKRIDEEMLNKKVKDDFEKIRLAFKNKDADMLKRIFNNKL